jgi:hypothetical protein
MGRCVAIASRHLESGGSVLFVWSGWSSVKAEVPMFPTSYLCLFFLQRYFPPIPTGISFLVSAQSLCVLGRLSPLADPAGGGAL